MSSKILILLIAIILAYQDRGIYGEDSKNT